MATTRDKFVNKCEDIVVAKPVYKNGASSTSECDCIGMVKYGLRQNGINFSTSGTNYSFRHHVDNIRSIHSASDLKFGDVVFKAYEPGQSGWNLPAKYQQGGSEYNGDLNDYYHIGVVKSVNPLEIIHMTSPTAKRDTKIGTWVYAASLKSQYVEDAPSPEPPGPGPTPEPGQQATVYAENGKPVKLRAKPSTNCGLYDELPVGTVVDVVSVRSDGWTCANYKNRHEWYIMTSFLRFQENNPDDDGDDSDDEPYVEYVSITIDDITIEEAEALRDEYPQAIITVG